ncbi:MAG: hypothetical protein LKJ50_01700 [Clostridiales bacterium]|jgi:hypothetical protein|nr:hypothetical protein [Clostridiales bacterium]MCI1951484.1 hypothetical protein [Clostridiales bacterium]MCI1960613.1 hypothetical protein [Clostridiales bacterium]MCI1960659.1 hypothetical protein [Clostridiales bacterium]MCI2021100.1 hypothetical protein [Clostridiales bacterium]
MGRNNVNVKGLPSKHPDAVLNFPETDPKEIDEKIRQLEKECEKLTDWPNPDK